MTVFPSALRGFVSVPPSKSEILRLLLCAALYGNGTTVSYASACDDVSHMEACLTALSAPTPILDCGESAAVLRFLLPAVTAMGKPAVFRLSPGLARRPLLPLVSLLRAHGASVLADGSTLTVSGSLRPGVYEVPTADTSQYLSGLLMALPLVGACSAACTSPLPSAGYVRMTLDALSKFGVTWTNTGSLCTLTELAPRSPGSLVPEGDWSSAAVWICINALPGHSVVCTGLSETSLQPDRAVLSLTEQVMAAGGTIDCTGTPDLLPVLAVLAAKAPHPVTFTGISRLRGKESDRIGGTADIINHLGGHALIGGDFLTVTPTGGYTGGTVHSRNDHRLAMAATLAACMSSAPVTIDDARCVSKSYPRFWDDFTRIGGHIQGADIL